MAHYYGSVSGRAQSEASRLGTKNTGISATVASWAGSCTVTIHWSEADQADILCVDLEPWHNGAGTSQPIYRGRIDQFQGWLAAKPDPMPDPAAEASQG